MIKDIFNHKSREITKLGLQAQSLTSDTFKLRLEFNFISRMRYVAYLVTISPISSAFLLLG